MPPRIPHHVKFELHWEVVQQLLQWQTFNKVGLPWLVGSVFIGLPVAILSFFVTAEVVKRHQARAALASPSDSAVPVIRG